MTDLDEVVRVAEQVKALIHQDRVFDAARVAQGLIRRDDFTVEYLHRFAEIVYSPR